VNTTIKICADIKHFLERLDDQITTDRDVLEQRRAWLRDLRGSDCPCRSTKGLDPTQVIEAVDSLTRTEKIVVTTGVGSHQHWVARNFIFDSPQRMLLTSGGHGTMGYDLPSAIGAALTESVQKVLCFVGDASFQMNIQELQTVVEHNLPIKIFVLDNNRMALVSQFQNSTWKSDPATGNVANPSFAKIAKAYGLAAKEVHTLAELKEHDAAQLITSLSPALFHCHIDHLADLSPMLLANDKLDAMSL
jgi:acetolactate synthase-1/2/3 large subunit